MECEEQSLREMLASAAWMHTAKLIMNTVGAGASVTIGMQDGSTLTLEDQLTALRTLRASFGWQPDD